MDSFRTSWPPCPVSASVYIIILHPYSFCPSLDAMEGKAMAIDSSIWIYQFQATMRDKDGRALVNAHVLGFLRRICKLLFYGIKPVFVFDGGAPTLKRTTIVSGLAFPPLVCISTSPGRTETQKGRCSRQPRPGG